MISLFFLFSYRLFSTQWLRVILLKCTSVHDTPPFKSTSQSEPKIQHDLTAIGPVPPPCPTDSSVNTLPLCHSPETHLPPNTPQIYSVLYSLRALPLGCSLRYPLGSVAQHLQVFACMSTFPNKPV